MSGFRGGFGSPPQSPVVSTTGTFSGKVSAPALLSSGRPTFMPPPGEFEEVTGKTPAWLALCDEASGALRDAVGNANLTAAGTPTYQRWKANRRGIFLDSDADYFSAAAVLEPGVASQAIACLWSPTTDSGNTRQICGKFSTGSGIKLEARLLGSDEKVYVYISDGTRSANTAALGGVAVTFGDDYLVMYQVDRAAGLLRTRLVNLTTGVVGTAANLDISLYTTLTGGTGPTFSIGFTTGLYWGGGFWYGGICALSGEDAEGATVLEDLAVSLGAEAA